MRCPRYDVGLCGRINHCGRVGGTKQISAFKLLTRINSSCSSGYEEKSVSGTDGRLMRPQTGNLEIVKYCVANQCPIDGRVQVLPKRSSRGTQILTKTSSALEFLDCHESDSKWSSPHTNILLSVNLMNTTHFHVYMQPRKVT